MKNATNRARTRRASESSDGECCRAPPPRNRHDDVRFEHVPRQNAQVRVQFVVARVRDDGPAVAAVGSRSCVRSAAFRAVRAGRVGGRRRVHGGRVVQVRQNERGNRDPFRQDRRGPVVADVLPGRPVRGQRLAAVRREPVAPQRHRRPVAARRRMCRGRSPVPLRVRILQTGLPLPHHTDHQVFHVYVQARRDRVGRHEQIVSVHVSRVRNAVCNRTAIVLRFLFRRHPMVVRYSAAIPVLFVRTYRILKHDRADRIPNCYGQQRRQLFTEHTEFQQQDYKIVSTVRSVSGHGQRC